MESLVKKFSTTIYWFYFSLGFYFSAGYFYCSKFYKNLFTDELCNTSPLGITN